VAVLAADAVLILAAFANFEADETVSPAFFDSPALATLDVLLELDLQLLLPPLIDLLPFSVLPFPLLLAGQSAVDVGVGTAIGVGCGMG